MCGDVNVFCVCVCSKIFETIFVFFRYDKERRSVYICIISACTTMGWCLGPALDRLGAMFLYWSTQPWSIVLKDDERACICKGYFFFFPKQTKPKKEDLLAWLMVCVVVSRFCKKKITHLYWLRPPIVVSKIGLCCVLLYFLLWVPWCCAYYTILGTSTQPVMLH